MTAMPRLEASLTYCWGIVAFCMDCQLNAANNGRR